MGRTISRSLLRPSSVRSGAGGRDGAAAAPRPPGAPRLAAVRSLLAASLQPAACRAQPGLADCSRSAAFSLVNTLSYGITVGNSRVAEVAQERGAGRVALGAVLACSGAAGARGGERRSHCSAPSCAPDSVGLGSGSSTHLVICLSVPPSASREAGKGGPGAAAPEQEAGAHGGPGPDADPHDGAALPADVQQGGCLGPGPGLAAGLASLSGSRRAAPAHTPASHVTQPCVARSTRGGVRGEGRGFGTWKTRGPGAGGQQRRDSLGGDSEVVVGLQGEPK